MSTTVPEHPPEFIRPQASPSPADCAPLHGAAPRMQVDRPDRDAVLVSVSGDLDEVSTPSFEELLTPRLKAAVAVVIVDLSQVSFLGVAALSLLIRAYRRAQARGMALRLVTGPPAVRRALHAGGLPEAVEIYPDRAAAMAGATQPGQ